MSRLGRTDLNALKREVADTLYAFHGGRARSVTSKQLARRLNQHPDRIRAAISELVTEGQPIGSVKDGYFAIESPREATECYRHLESRARKIFRRLAGLRRGVVAKFGNQLKLGLDNDVVVEALERVAKAGINLELNDPENVPRRPFA